MEKSELAKYGYSKFFRLYINPIGFALNQLLLPKESKKYVVLSGKSVEYML